MSCPPTVHTVLNQESSPGLPLHGHRAFLDGLMRQHEDLVTSEKQTTILIASVCLTSRLLVPLGRLPNKHQPSEIIINQACQPLDPAEIVVLVNLHRIAFGLLLADPLFSFALHSSKR
jgi:hypothetical protein